MKKEEETSDGQDDEAVILGPGYYQTQGKGKLSEEDKIAEKELFPDTSMDDEKGDIPLRGPEGNNKTILGKISEGTKETKEP